MRAPHLEGVVTAYRRQRAALVPVARAPGYASHARGSRNLEQALGLLTMAVRDCTDALWETSMWPVPADPDRQFLGPDWQPITDPTRRRELSE